MESDVNVAVLSLKKFVVSYLNYFVDGHGYINNDSHSTKLKGGGLTKLFLSQFCLSCVDLSLQNKVCTEGWDPFPQFDAYIIYNIKKTIVYVRLA